MSPVPLRISFVVGTFPPELCGVGSYTERLADALADRGHDVDVVLAPKGTPTAETLRRLGEGRIVHLQYPTVGIGASLSPLALLIRERRSSVVTLHEYTHVHPARRSLVLALASAARRVVFTTEIERDAVARWVPRRGDWARVIPVGSNIPVLPRSDDERVDVVHFGLIGPNKGLDDFLRLVERSHLAGDPFSFAVIGGWPPAHARWVRDQQRATEHLPLRWTGPLSPEALSLELHRARLAYVPFPDGASERRASLLALLEHRVPTITTAGSATTPGLRAATVIASSPDAAHASLQRVDAHEWSSLAARGSEYVSARSWPAIAARHEELYRTIVLPRPSR